MRRKRLGSPSWSDVPFDVFIHATLALLVFVTVYPILHVLAASLSTGLEVVSGNVGIVPKGWTTLAYRKVIEAGRVPRAFLNSTVYTTVGTLVNLVLTTTMAYPLSKRNLKFRGFYTVLVMVTMFFGGGLIPTFLVVLKLGMYNSLWALIMPGAISTWNLLVMRTFFQGVPAELDESASLDGANDAWILVRIVLPLSTAALATISLFYAVGHWNSWMPGIIYLKTASKYPLQVVLQSMVVQGQVGNELSITDADDRLGFLADETLKYATLFLSMLPMMALYPFLQKHFVKGVMIGSLKG